MRPELGQEENHEEQEKEEEEENQEEEQEEAPFKELFVISFCYRGLKKPLNFAPKIWILAGDIRSPHMGTSMGQGGCALGGSKAPYQHFWD